MNEQNIVYSAAKATTTGTVSSSAAMIMPHPFQAPAASTSGTAATAAQYSSISSACTQLPPLRELIDRSPSTPRSLPPLMKLAMVSSTARRKLPRIPGVPPASPELSFKQIQDQLLKSGPEPGYIHVWNNKIGRGARYKKKIHVKTCHICGKEFSRPSTLKTHVVVHTEARPFICRYPGCDKSYNVRSNLRRHEKTHQMHGSWTPSEDSQ